MVRRSVAVGLAVGVGIIGLVAALFVYSYSQIKFSISDIGFAGIDWASASGTTILKALSGDYLGAALSLINGIKLDLTFAASNHGFLPVYIPDLTYDLAINGISVGQGQSHVNVVINPGETKNIPVLQVIQKSSIEPAAASLLETGGIMNIKVSGTANFQLLGMTVPVPFQSTKQVSITEEIQKRFSSSQPTRASTFITIRSSSYSIYQGDTVTFSGRLTDDANNGMAHKPIYIKQARSLAIDPVLASGYTNGDGSYSIAWTSDKTGSLNIYTLFEASSGYSEGRSNEIIVSILEMQQPVPQTPGFYATTISIQVSPTTVKEGNIVSITGRLITTEGQAVQNAAINIKDEDLGSGDDLIATVYTDSTGSYSYNWSARQMDPFDNVVEIYAIYEGSSNIGQARSDQINVTVT